MSEFDKWYKEKYYKYDLYPKYAQFRKEMEEVWQAATAESDKCVRELTATIAELEASNELLHEALESNQISEKELLSYRNHINVLREALVDIAKTNASTHGTTQMMLAHCIKSANEALASTPAQSLQAHDDAVIERCAKLIEPDEEHRKDASWGYIGGEEGVELLDNAAESIRALKGQP